jgi:hypothetical protein
VGGESELGDEDRCSDTGETETESNEESSTYTSISFCSPKESKEGRRAMIKLTNEHANILSSSLNSGSNEHH